MEMDIDLEIKEKMKRIDVSECLKKVMTVPVPSHCLFNLENFIGKKLKWIMHLCNYPPAG